MRVSDRDAFTYGSCGGDIMPKHGIPYDYRMKPAHSWIIQQVRDARTPRDIGPFRHYKPSRFGGDWIAWRLFTDALEIAQTRIDKAQLAEELLSQLNN